MESILTAHGGQGREKSVGMMRNPDADSDDPIVAMAETADHANC
jgi:hypothetical protein